MRYSKLWPVVARVAVLLLLVGLRTWLPAAVAIPVRNPQIVTDIARAIDAACWLVAASLLVHLTNALIWRRIVSYALGAPAPSLLRDTSTTLIYGGAATAVVTLVFGGSFTAFWTASGALGLVIGLALRSIILDLFTGVAFSVELSFRIGDWLELVEREAGVPYYGRVVGMSWRTTRIELEDRRVVIVPNSRMGQLIAINSSLQGGVVRAEVLITLDFAVPTSRAFRVLEGAVMSLAHTGAVLLDPTPRVLIGAVTQQGVDYRVRYWKDIKTASPSATRSVVFAGLLEHLAAAGLDPVVPKQEIELELVRSGGKRAAAEKTDHRESFLARVDLFADALTPSELSRLAAAMVRHMIGPGDVLLREGDQGKSLFVLCEGALAVVREAEAEVVQLTIIQPGQIVGEMSLLTGATRSATVKAITESLVYEVDADALAPLLAERPEILETLSEIAAARNRAAVSDLRSSEDIAADLGLLQRIRRFFAGVQADVSAAV